MNLKISGHSTALYSTYWAIEPLGLLFDCGDGAAATLQQKGRKVKTIACSHADRDHLSGLFQFLQLNSTSHGPRVLYPKDCGSFPAIEDFTEQFDPHVAGNANWQGIGNGDIHQLKPNTFLEAYSNRHIPRSETSQGQHKSLSYSIYRDTLKLKPEFSSLSGPEIGRLRKERPAHEIVDVVRSSILTYSADTPIESATFWKDPEVLIHEATFLNEKDLTSRKQEARHSSVPDVIKMVADMPNLKALILGHFSCRYNHEQIGETIQAEAKRWDIKVPIYAVLPGCFERDILSSTPVWQPA